jgi:hypothetical protein
MQSDREKTELLCIWIPLFVFHAMIAVTVGENGLSGRGKPSGKSQNKTPALQKLPFGHPHVGEKAHGEGKWGQHPLVE